MAITAPPAKNPHDFHNGVRNNNLGFATISAEHGP
jgi:hypothetical protein